MRTTLRTYPYMSLKPDPNCIAVDAFDQKWNHLFPYAFPPFNLIGRVLRKALEEKVTMIVITPIWMTQPWYPMILDMAIDHPTLLPMGKNLLRDARENLIHS